MNSREDCLVLESKCFAHSPYRLPERSGEISSSSIFDGLVGRDAFGWAVSNNTLAAIPSTEKFVREKSTSDGTGGRRLQTVTPRVAQTTMLDAKTTETKNDDNYNNNNDHNTTNDDGKMTVTQNRTNVGLAQMRKTKQTTLVPSFPMSGKRKRMKIFLRERITLQPPILLLKQAQLQMRMLFANCGAATRLRMMTVTMNIPLTIAKKKRKKSLTAAPASCSNDDHNWSEDSWDFAT